MFERKPESWREAVQLAEKFYGVLGSLPEREEQLPEDLAFLRHELRELILRWLDVEVLALEE